MRSGPYVAHWAAWRVAGRKDAVVRLDAKRSWQRHATGRRGAQRVAETCSGPQGRAVAAEARSDRRGAQATPFHLLVDHCVFSARFAPCGLLCIAKLGASVPSCALLRPNVCLCSRLRVLIHSASHTVGPLPCGLLRASVDHWTRTPLAFSTGSALALKSCKITIKTRIFTSLC